jgi:hypothetical protein
MVMQGHHHSLNSLLKLQEVMRNTESENLRICNLVYSNACLVVAVSRSTAPLTNFLFLLDAGQASNAGQNANEYPQPICARCYDSDKSSPTRPLNTAVVFRYAMGRKRYQIQNKIVIMVLYERMAPILKYLRCCSWS